MNLEFQALLEGSDDDFNAIYPSHIRRLAKKHWTPIDVRKAQRCFWLTGAALKCWISVRVSVSFV